MYLLGTVRRRAFPDGPGRPRRPRLLPLPRPLGHSFDAEKSLDAPIDGFMISAKSPSLAEDLDAPRPISNSGPPATHSSPDFAKSPGQHRRRRRTPTRAATATLQKKAAEVIGSAQQITQFLDRDTQPELRRTERDAGVPARIPEESRPRTSLRSREDPGVLGSAATHGDSLPERASTDVSGPNTRGRSSPALRRTRRSGGAAVRLSAKKPGRYSLLTRRDKLILAADGRHPGSC